MEQYPVPQFIEQEGRIAFFITFRQFFLLIVAGAICFILYYTLPRPLFVPAAFILFGLALAFGFIKVSGVPLHEVLLNSLGFMTGAKNYTWKKKEALYPFKVSPKVKIAAIEEQKALKMADKSRLKKLTAKVELKAK